jgi:hypothetical protein
MKITNTQLSVVERMRADGGVLERWPGGFWTTPSSPVEKVDSDGVKVPEWYVEIRTVRALVAKNLVEVTKRQETHKFEIEVRFRECPECLERTSEVEFREEIQEEICRECLESWQEDQDQLGGEYAESLQCEFE